MGNTPPSDPQAAAEVFYDGGCPLCRREIAAYQRLPGLEGTVWTDVDTTATLPEALDRDAALARFHIRRHDGRITSGARAFLAVWRGVPRLRWLAVALDRRPFVDVAELAYRGFLKLRPLWR
ncbi:thiol-disulfide oxidoreductase DCC family protein [Oceanibium sediminis]|uniref:thiol-disulfide oxidoreductase DCC family protein n=1 Tax=Oceanibium sediminis TaxID=2026339 RepID=UPI000DD2FB91|nr:DUF393 domain-containing protein [Oceanibium sediminis]